MKTMIRIVAAILLLVIATSADWAAAKVVGSQSEPIYNPATKSYFQLFDDNVSPGTWDAAQQRANSKYFKGVSGRLAIINSQETHDFLIRNFDFEDERMGVWIGLRYWCQVRMLQWVGQRLYSPAEPGHFKVWHTPWSRYHQPCLDVITQQMGFLPAYYRTMNGTTRWQAVGLAKGFRHYFVEFPTGHE